MTPKERFIAAIRGVPVDRIPVFPLLMGLSAKKSGFTYKQFASDGSALAQAQLKMLEEFNLDATSVCSDAFRISADLGGDVIFDDQVPPRIRRPIIESQQDLGNLKRIDVTRKGSRCADRINSVGEIVNAVGATHYVLGWVDFPFAEACSCCGVQNFMMIMMDEPELAHGILRFLTDIDIDFALAQLDKGAPMIGCGDAAASLVSDKMFREFALPYEKQVVDAIHDNGGLVKTHICGNTSTKLESIAHNGSDLYNVDHMVDLEEAIDVYSRYGKAVKGNVNPVFILQAGPEEISNAAKKCIELAKGKKYILGAGCEIPLDTPDENLLTFCQAVI